MLGCERQRYWTPRAEPLRRRCRREEALNRPRNSESPHVDSYEDQEGLTASKKTGSALCRRCRLQFASERLRRFLLCLCCLPGRDWPKRVAMQCRGSDVVVTSSALCGGALIYAGTAPEESSIETTWSGLSVWEISRSSMTTITRVASAMKSRCGTA